MKKHPRRVPVEILVFGFVTLLVGVLALLVNVNQETSSLPNFGEAPELAGVSGWVNSEPLKIEDLKGRVVMIDFWTYTCINCIRTLPHLNELHEKYRDKGLVLIGVHTPEFEFEKDPANVRNAIERYGIKYAVVQDNDYATWRAFGNNYWPRQYLIDKEGNIRYDHIGEGGYEATEKAIQQLLGIEENMLQNKQAYDLSQVGTPELYLGYRFARTPLGNPVSFVPEMIVDYGTVNITTANIVYLQGTWLSRADRSISIANGSVFLIYRAKDVNIVASGDSSADIFLDGFRATEGLQGKDVSDGTLVVDFQRLYNIVSTENYGAHLLEIRTQPGFELYTFTFG